MLNIESYAAGSDIYVPAQNTPIILTAALDFSDNTHDVSKDDFVYYMFKVEVAGDLTITVTDVDTINVKFNDATNAYPSAVWSNGVKTKTFSNLAIDDIIYIAVADDSASSNNSADKYLLVASLTPAAISDSNLTITKIGSVEVITIGEDFYYTISVTNKDTETATGINVTDILPEDMEVYLTRTNDASDPYWECTQTSDDDPVICEHNATIPGGGTHTIILHVKAPSSLGTATIENNATVTGIIDGESVTDSALESTELTNEQDSAENLCYISLDTSANCDKEGNFYYGRGCTAEVTIVDTNVSDEGLRDLTITKMYAPELDHGSAYLSTDSSDIKLPSAVNITGYTSYTEGYVMPVIALDNNTSVTMSDTDSYNNGNQMFGIILYADYNISIGSEDVDHSGRIYACTGGEGDIEVMSSADIIDTLITNPEDASNYNSSVVPSVDDTDIKFIRTMIADDNTREIVGVYLDLGQQSLIYDYNGSGNTDLPYQITPLWSDTTCSTYLGHVIDPATNEQLIIEIPSGSYSATGTIEVPNKVNQDLRMQLIFIDPNTLSVEGQNCLDGSTTGNFLQLAQCVNSELQYKTAFGQTAWDRCGIDSGTPCVSTNHGAANPLDPSYDPDEDFIYLTDLGCYLCTFNIEPVCSSDNFAIRPKAFDVNIADGEIFVAGQNINLTFEAENWNDTTETYDYNETEDSSFAVDINMTDDTKNCPVTVELYPSVHFEDGIKTGDFFFNDIGKDLNFTVSEINGSEYALVDFDDSNDTVRFITPFERNITVIPDRFNIDANLSDHNTANDFTYLHDIHTFDSSDNYEMSATLTIDIQAMGADDNITRNYMETCYAKDTNITLDLSGTNITYPGSTQALEYFLYYNPVEDNGTTNSGEGSYLLPDPVGNTITLPSLPIVNVPSSFSADAPDGNGTTYIEYKLNFDRKQNLVVNPFQIVLNDVNITEIDDDIAPADLVTGDTGALSDQNATMYYARSRASKFFYEDINETAVLTPILIDIYCDLGHSACDLLGIDSVLGEIDVPNWWLSLGHNETTHNDGNITLIIGEIIKGDGSPVVDTDVTVDAQAKDGTITVTSGATDLPMTVIIDLDETSSTDTNHWIIYNPDSDVSAPTPFYKVRFIGDSTWTGPGITGDIVDISSSRKKSKKMDW